MSLLTITTTFVYNYTQKILSTCGVCRNTLKVSIFNLRNRKLVNISRIKFTEITLVKDIHHFYRYQCFFNCLFIKYVDILTSSLLATFSGLHYTVMKYLWNQKVKNRSVAKSNPRAPVRSSGRIHNLDIVVGRS